MIFPVCPGCGQSVIDDDAKDCPFCGTSMSAKPGTVPKKPAMPSKAAAPPAVKPAAGTVPRGGLAAKPAVSDDHPFDAPAEHVGTVIPVMAAPGKGRTLQVVCPMCDKPGYLLPSAAGEKVKCWNPRCPLPIFQAPAAEVEPPPPPPAKKPPNLVLLAMVTAGIMLVIGGGLYFWALQPSNKVVKKPISDEDLALIREMTATQNSQQNPAGNAAGGNTANVTDGAKAAVGKTKPGDGGAGGPMSERLRRAINETVLVSGRTNRSKPFCRRLAADAMVAKGDLGAAREQLNQLLKVGPEVPYYRIGPLTEIAWQELAAGKIKPAKEAAATALGDSAKLPTVGRDQMVAAARLAVLLCALGQQAEAKSLVGLHEAVWEEGILAAEEQARRLARADGQFALDVHRLLDSPVCQMQPIVADRPAIPWRNPQSLGVLHGLWRRQKFAEALAWSQQAFSGDGAVEAATVLTQLHAAQPAPEAVAAKIPTFKDPASQIRLLARRALGQLAASDAAGATETVATAVALGASLTLKPAFAVPDDLPSLVKLKTTPVGTPRENAAALADLALAQVRLGQADAASATLVQAYQQLQALAPTLSLASGLVADFEAASPATSRDAAKRAFSVKTDDEARQKVNDQRRILKELQRIAGQRYELELAILERAVELGAGAGIWPTLQAVLTAANQSGHQPFIGTSLVPHLVEAMRQKASGSEAPVVDVWNNLTGSAEMVRTLSQQLELTIATPTDAMALEDLFSSAFLPADREREIAVVVTGFSDVPRLNKLLTWISRWNDKQQVGREEAYALIATRATELGFQESIWKHLMENVTQSTEKLALIKGISLRLKE